MSAVVQLLKNTYVDSVVQLSGTRAMRAVDGVDWASAAMATPANLAVLEAEGFDPAHWSGAGSGDLVLAIRAGSDEVAGRAEEAGRDALFAARGNDGDEPREAPPRSVLEAVERAPTSTVAVISVPGEHAALETHLALSAGLDVLLFSDNVPVHTEIELKERAARLGRLVMGPGAGTAMLGGTCLGFANVVGPAAERTGSVAVVAAAGTGAQEAASLLDRWGVGVTHVIGLGGRDLSAAVGGTMGRLAVRTLARLSHESGRGVDAILLVSKPPDPDVARTVLAEAGGTPLVAALLGMEAAVDAPSGVTQCSTLEGGARATVAALGLDAPAPVTPDAVDGLRDAVTGALDGLPAHRTAVRGLYSGGTLCYEALVVLGQVLGPVYSNTPIDPARGLPPPQGAHVCLDLGEEEYTQGRPHPMIDPEARIEQLREQARDPDVAAIVLDVVLGFGAHDDPASALGPVIADVVGGPDREDGPRVVVYVLGTEHDPQGLEAQRRAFARAGALVTGTAARAALVAAAVARREPSIIDHHLG